MVLKNILQNQTSWQDLEKQISDSKKCGEADTELPAYQLWYWASVVLWCASLVLWWGILFIYTYWCRWWWHSFENDDAADEENFRWLVNMLANVSRWYWQYCPPDATGDADLSRLMLLKKTLLVKGEFWNNVTAKSILIIIIILFIGLIPIED